jgi:hypothetical protein
MATIASSDELRALDLGTATSYLSGAISGESSEDFVRRRACVLGVPNSARKRAEIIKQVDQRAPEPDLDNCSARRLFHWD